MGNRQYVTTIAVLLAHLFPRVRLTVWRSRSVTLTAAYAFPIYLVHRVVPELKGSAGSALPLPALHLLAIAGGITNDRLAPLRNLLATTAIEREPELLSA